HAPGQHGHGELRALAIAQAAAGRAGQRHPARARSAGEMSPLPLVALGTLLVVLIMTALWLLGIRNKNFSYVDIGWSGNFTLLAFLYAALAEGWQTRKWLIAAMY